MANISVYKSHYLHFALVLTISEMLIFPMFVVVNLDQSMEYNICNFAIQLRILTFIKVRSHF